MKRRANPRPLRFRRSPRNWQSCSPVHRRALAGFTRSSSTAIALLAMVNGGRMRLLTRRGNDWTGTFPSIARAFEKPKVDSAIIDGEVVARPRSQRFSAPASIHEGSRKLRAGRSTSPAASQRKAKKDSYGLVRRSCHLIASSCNDAAEPGWSNGPACGSSKS